MSNGAPLPPPADSQGPDDPDPTPDSLDPAEPNQQPYNIGTEQNQQPGP